MPWRSFADGPECEDPKLIARRWDDVEEIRDRAKDKQKLFQLVKDEGGNEVAWPTPENMSLNKALLEVLVKDMLSRTRVGADPIEIITKMVSEHYTLHRNDFQEYFTFQIKGWIANDAWAIRKMVSTLRNKITKHDTMRAAWAQVLTTFGFLSAPKHSRSEGCLPPLITWFLFPINSNYKSACHKP
jgi:hypothetical protein